MINFLPGRMLPQKIKIGVTLGLLIFCLNSVIVKADFDNRSNNWHYDDINCYTCSNEEECALSEGLIQKCEGNNAQTCVTVFNELGVVAQRGCSDRILASQYNIYCNTNPAKCPSCSSSGCNEATSLDRYVECLSCDSSVDKNCVLKPNEITTKTMCYGECMTALYATNSGNNSSYNLVRSCLNDRDLDSRSICLNGSDGKCVGCSGANCNVVALPANRHSCYRCYGDTCEDPEIEECTIFKEEDQCFIRFENDSNDMIEMGCLSDFDSEETIIDLVKQKLLLICDGADCNGFESLPPTYECTQCSSANLEACATKPTTATDQQPCRIMPYTQCYQRVNGVATERGCLSDLSGDEFYNCLTGADDKCKVCEGNNCNEEIIPADRKRCQRCTSESDVLCHSSPAASSVCPSYSTSESCVAVYENGITKRGCQSEFTCNADSKTCQICSEDDCNTSNIKKRLGEVYGIFQDLPLNCDTCSGDECLPGNNRNPRMCEGDVHQDCMTVFNANDKVLRRGCENLVLSEYQSHCNANPELCFNCKSNGCNDMTNSSSYQECLYCDATSNPDCLFNPSAITETRKCPHGCISSLYSRRSNPKVYDFVRTCFDDIEPDNRDDCTPEKNCVKCSADKCNTVILPEQERLSCFYCDGDDCDVPQSKQCTGYAADDQCYMKFHNVSHSVIRMGCRSDEFLESLATDIKLYFLCDGDNCNTYENLPEAKFCALCNSEDDVNCAVDPSKVSAETRCGIYPYTQCFTRIRDDGHTERGCLSSLPTDIFISCSDGHVNSRCRICTDNNCNKNIYPSSRQKCYRCNTSTNLSCENEPTTLQACPIYMAADGCVTQYIDGVTHRGCASEITCDGLSRKNCHTCLESGCNNVNLADQDIGEPGLFQALPLNCYNCNGTQECRASNGGINVCSGNKKQTCTTAFNKEGDIIVRGCSDALESTCSAEGNLCYDCKSNGCNLAKNESDFIDCIFCNSQNSDDCTFNVDEIKRTRKCNGVCMTALYPRTADDIPVYELIRTCLDDKDLDDRQSCENSSDDKCKSCTGAKCNKDNLGKRKSCYQCKGDECQDPKIQTCRGVMDNDQCFVQWDETGSIVEMGCKSKYDQPEVEILVKAQYLWLCDGDNCNDFEQIPKAQSCVLCNSRTDSNCAINPAGVKSSTTCAKLPYTQCYSRVLENGHTERGCLSNLEDNEFYNCLNNKNASECSSCVGDNCNQEIFPADRRSCQRCNTKEDPDCESSPNFASICPVYSSSQYCVTKLVNDHTYRGCSTEFECDDSDKQYCRLCHNSNNCNVVDLVSSNIGHPGKWQSIPINCHTCKAAECLGDKLGPIQMCANNKLQNCATVFALNGSVIERGCTDVIYKGNNSNYCDENPIYCKFCKSNGCNSAISLGDYGDCLFCDGSDNTDCVFNPQNIKRTRTCHNGCMTSLYLRTDEANPAYELARGCLDDLELDDRDECRNGTKSYCQACDANSCNTAKIPAIRLKCNICNGADCEDPQSAECSAFRENDQCFTLFVEDNNVQRMGCASDLDNSFLVENTRKLLLCDGDNCNSFENFPTPVSCRWCNSKDNLECASNPLATTAVACHLYPNTECFTRIDQDGITHRGCLSDVSDGVFQNCTVGNSSNCEVCNSNDCNNKIYPEDRRSCVQCDSALFPACEDNASSFSSTCRVYSKNDSCVTKLEGDRTIRGCSSEFTCDTSNRDTCRICNSGDNCNTVNLLQGFVGEPGKWQGLPLICRSCEGADCISDNGSLRKCEDNNLQTCTTVFGANGTVVKRGCSDDVTATHGEYCDENSDKCISCKSNGCNNAQSLNDFVDCYYCDSSDSANCAINFVASRAKTRKCQDGCMVALYQRSSVNDPAYELVRTCLDDMELTDREICASGENEYCKACKGSRCNTMNIPDERYECFKCTDDDCEDMESKQCTAYHPNDQCYVLYNNQSSIIAMGCRSEFEMETATELVKQKQMLVCNGNNCNAPQLMPTPKSCSVCNSEENPLCATNPNLIANVERCSSLPYTECYTRVKSNGHTERGCLGSLETEAFYGCLMNTDRLCETCVGDKCNEIDVYPADRLKCQQCNSLTDPLCATAPNSNKVCQIYDENDFCLTNFHNGITTRGCASNMKCDNQNNPRTCRVCTGNGCNIVNLEKVSVDGVPGRFQEIPLTCYDCRGEENCIAKGDFRPCLNNPFQNCATVFSAENKVIQRGCSDVVDADNGSYCEKNPEKCLRCNSNACNVATSLEEYVECVACDSDDNSDCINNVAGITKTRQCYKNCVTLLYARFIEEDPSYDLTRSCFDDMEMDDRNACAAGNKEHCQVCSGTKCNMATIPAKRLSCYMCEDDDCQDPKAQECLTYRADDKCYIRFDENLSVVAMGCRSEFKNVDADYLVKQKRLHLCAADNCNTFEQLPVAQTCALCNSRTDGNCAVNPSGIASQTTCAVLPFTECYSRVLSDGATERGCLSNLYDDEFMGCLNGTSATCKACQGNNCNKDIFPDSRLKCYICDSSVDPTCTSAPKNLSICPKYDAEDSCVTAFRNDVTYRGCSSSLACDVTNPRSCVKCSGDGCNTVNLAKKQDDNFGKWQDLPLRCLSCSDSECDAAATTQSLTCELNNEQDCMTVFNASGKVVRRGCTDIVEREYGVYCDENTDSCYSCKSNECNTAVAKTEFVKCVYCDSHKDLECVWNPMSSVHNSRQCQGHCMTALFPTDNSANPAYGLIRTCLNDKENKDQTTCSNSKDAKCKACIGSQCNTDNLPVNRLTCYICEGESCEKPEAKYCPLYKEVDQCYIRFDGSNSVSEMGCVSSFHNQELESIIKTKRVSVCSGANCNSLDTVPSSQSCAVCDSTDDVSCAVNPIDIGTFNTCSMLPYTSCYSKLTKRGTTERGCLTDLPADDFAACVLGNDKNCGVCNEDGCNREIFPANRQQCYTCTSEEESNCESFPTSKMACPLVSDSEACVTALSGNVTIRGCKSNILCDANDSFTCRSCFGSECNSIDLFNKVDDGYHGVWQNLPLRCHTCEEEHCSYSLGPSVTCSGSNINQDCMTVFNNMDQVISRGCSDDVEDYRDLYCRQNPEMCFKCKSNECNAAWSISEYVECAFCDSNTDALCIVNPESTGFGKRKCYKECMAAMKDQQVIRSCLDDKELLVQNSCQLSNSKECASCGSNNCNKFAFPEDRLKCHVCTGSSCTGSVGQYCQLYESSDYCFAKYENGKVDLMGCATAQNASDIADWTAQNKLYKCAGNDCNELSRLPQGGVCLACNSSKSPNCAQNPLLITSTESCLAPSDECFTKIDSGGYTIRGCFSNLDASEQNCKALGTCAVCTGEKCNNQIYPANRRECHICNSVADKSCTQSPSSLQVCPIFVNNDSCVTTLSADGILTRGCGSQVKCDNTDSDYCDVCNSDGCNTVELKGAASVAAHSIMLTLLLAFLSILVLKH